MKTLTFVMLAILATVSTAASSPDGNPPDCDNLIAVHEKQEFNHFQAQAKEELALIRKQEEKMKVLKDRRGSAERGLFLHWPGEPSRSDWKTYDTMQENFNEAESELKQAHKEAKLKMQGRHAKETLALIRKQRKELKAMKCLTP